MIQVIIQAKEERTLAALRHSITKQTRHALVLKEPSKKHEWTLLLTGDVLLRPTAIATLEALATKAPAQWIGCQALVLHTLWGALLPTGNKFVRTSELKNSETFPTPPSCIIGLQGAEQSFSTLYAFGEDLAKNHLPRLELPVKYLRERKDDPDAKVVLQAIHDTLIKVKNPLPYPEKGELKEVDPSWIEKQIIEYNR